MIVDNNDCNNDCCNNHYNNNDCLNVTIKLLFGSFSYLTTCSAVIESENLIVLLVL